MLLARSSFKTKTNKMSIFTQNKKILITSVSLFMVSLLVILFVLDKSGAGGTYGKSDVLNSNSHGGEATENESGSPKTPYDIYLNGNSGPWFVTSADGEFVYLSEDFCNLLNTECKDLEKKNFFNYVNSKDLPEFAVLVTKLIRNTDKIEGAGPYRLLAKKEERLTIITAFPLLDKKKKVENIIFSVKDISEKVREMENSMTDEEVLEKLNADEDVIEWMKEVYPKVKDLKEDSLSGIFGEPENPKIAAES